MAGRTSVDDEVGDWFEVRLEPQPPSIAAARRHVRDVLLGGDRADLVDTCALLVSEVVTNAMLHAGTDIDLRARLVEAGVRVEVGDGSPHLPSRRRYAATAGTGRGLQMLEAMVEDWGVLRRSDGKTVWFVVASGDAQVADGAAGSGVHTTGSRHLRRRGDTVEVELRNLPLLLHAAWQEHAEALLRDHLLASLDADPGLDPGAGDPIQRHAEATDAIAVLEEHIPANPRRVIPDEVMADFVEPGVTAAVIDLSVPRTSVPNFETLDQALDDALVLAAEGVVLTPPVQPELQEFRRWVCREVRRQAHGESPQPWVVPQDVHRHPEAPSGWDPHVVASSERGVIAANLASQILTVSPEAARILGYDDPSELVGRRLVSIVPERYRQAHVAGFTMYLLVGRGPLMDSVVRIPAQRRDGSEVDVELSIHDLSVGDGGSVLVADIRLAVTPETGEIPEHGISGPAG